MMKLVPALVILLAAAPAFAQGGASQSPPSPNAASSAPEPVNSVPPGALNMNTGNASNPNVSGPVGTTIVTPGMTPGASALPVPAAPTGQQPMANTVPAPSK